MTQKRSELDTMEEWANQVGDAIDRASRAMADWAEVVQKQLSEALAMAARDRADEIDVGATGNKPTA